MALTHTFDIKQLNRIRRKIIGELWEECNCRQIGMNEEKTLEFNLNSKLVTCSRDSFFFICLGSHAEAIDFIAIEQ